MSWARCINPFCINHTTAQWGIQGSQVWEKNARVCSNSQQPSADVFPLRLCVQLCSILVQKNVSVLQLKQVWPRIGIIKALCETSDTSLYFQFLFHKYYICCCSFPEWSWAEESRSNPAVQPCYCKHCLLSIKHV